jgi:predicted helicase
MVLACNQIPDMHLVGGGASAQVFPFRTHSEDSKHKEDNVTLQALIRFQNFYDDETITREDIFSYVYAILHHPAYRSRYTENLKRELPRIPLVAADGTLHGPPKPDDDLTRKPSKRDAVVFHAFAQSGRKLVTLHATYEDQPEFTLERIESKAAPLDWRVETMKLSKDRTKIHYNDFLTLGGIPKQTFDYKLGNRSAIEWVIDQYRVTRDADAQITSDPNRLEDEQYIVRLIGQVITVSLETLKTTQALPPLTFT